jgi:uroporphyrinogen-III synthase
MKVIIIRPQPRADATAARASALGLEPTVMPLFAAEAVDWQAPNPQYYNALLITSANAMRHGGAALAGLQSLPVYAVGTQSADAACNAGFNVIMAGTSNAAALLESAASAGHNRLLWLAGADHMQLNPTTDMQIDTHIVYRSAALPAPSNYRDSLTPSCCVLLHSARAARHFRALCLENSIKLQDISIAALSQNVSEAAGVGWRQTIVAAQPTDNALLSAVLSCFTNDQCGP